MPQLVKKEECCEMCGHNLWIREEFNTNGKHEIRDICLFCATIKEKQIGAYRRDGKFAYRRVIMNSSTQTNREMK